MIKVGIIGCGYWGPNLIRNFILNPDCEIKLCCDLDPDRLKKVKRTYPHLKTTLNYKDLLRDPEISAVAISTQVPTHYRLAREALLAGKHILVEKPLAHSSTKAKELIKIADRRKLVLMVGHTFVYSPAVVKIKEMISEGILGKIYYISTSRVNLGIHQPDISVLWDLAPHDFSIIVYLLGEKPKYISTMAQDCVRKGIYDVSFINMRFASGTIAHVHLSWLAPTKLRRTIIVGDKRMIVYDDTLPDEKIKLYDRGVEFKEPKTFGEYELFYRVGKMISPPLDIHEPLNAEVDHFLRCCKTGKRPKTGGHEALQVIELIEAAERSLYNNGRLEVIK